MTGRFEFQIQVMAVTPAACVAIDGGSTRIVVDPTAESIFSKMNKAGTHALFPPSGDSCGRIQICEDRQGECSRCLVIDGECSRVANEYGFSCSHLISWRFIQFLDVELSRLSSARTGVPALR